MRAFLDPPPLASKHSDPAAGPTADTSSVSTSAQVLACVDAIKQQHGIKHVVCWHATCGYWGGVSPAAADVDAAAAASAAGAGGGDASGSSQGSDAAAAAVRAAVQAEVVFPRVTPIMSDLEPPTNWSQQVSLAE